ncbi:MAG: AAA family ATPase, partial [Gammaproteobacteria bacterium]|nr:AAA family ATPase [Gammaproteobacteria bacterium]
MELKDRLVLQLTKNPGQKASELATKLRADRKEINRILVTELNDRFEQDNSYRWNLILPTSHDESMKSHSGISDTPLSRLCRYYLACLGQDDLEEVSTWARSRYDYDYVELNTVPLGEIDRLLQKPEVSSLLATTRGDHLTKILYLGYPVCIHTFTSRSGDLIYRLEPVLFLPVQFDQPRNRGNASLSIDYPMINTSVLKRYSNSDRESLMGELVQLEEELGYMNSNPEVPELDEVAHRLYSIRKEWPWRERCDGGLLRNIPLINELDEPGIYNRAVLMSAERRPYTEGLEIELQHLSNLKESAYSHSILGNLVNGNIPERESVTNELHPLLEVLPMNEEQRQAINRSLTEPLTIITGPPGTGKSQVVTNLLINAAWQGKKVLFASKNNKAVDVVEIRVNSLGSRPILMRMGSGEYYQKLCDHIQGLLSTTSDTEQIQEYESTLAKYQDSKRKMEEINSEFDRVIEMRNKVDKLEQSVEHLRDEFGPDITQHIRSNLNKNWREQFSTFYKALSQNDKSKQSLFGRLLWPFIRKSRFAKLENVFHSIQKGLSEIGLSSNINLTEDTKLDYYYDLANNINFRLCEVEKISDYFQALVDLQTAESFESINKKKRQLFD